MKGHLGLTLGTLYALVCLLAVAYVVVGANGAELAGLLVLILGLPWTLILTFAIMALGSSSAWLLAATHAVSCILNCWLLYKFGSRKSGGTWP